MRDMTILAKVALLALGGLGFTIVAGIVPVLVYHQGGHPAWAIVPIVLLALLGLGVLAALVKDSISKTIDHLTTAAMEMAQGNFTPSLRRTNQRSELGRLEQALATLATNQQNFYTDLAETAAQHRVGNANIRFGHSYDGVYKEVVDNVNAMIDGYDQMIEALQINFDAMAAGEKIPDGHPYAGRIANLWQKLQNAQGAIFALEEDIALALEKIAQGDLAHRMDYSK